MMGPSRRLALLLARTGAAKHSSARSTVCIGGEPTSLTHKLAMMGAMLRLSLGANARMVHACSALFFSINVHVLAQEHKHHAAVQEGASARWSSGLSEQQAQVHTLPALYSSFSASGPLHQTFRPTFKWRCRPFLRPCPR